MSEDGIEREMHSELYNIEETKKIKVIQDTQLIKSYKPPKELNSIINGAKEDTKKDDKPNTKRPS
jgi:hypothetical protein